MFSDFMANTWIAATVIAVIAAPVGFFVVLRGSAFLAHAVPHGAFAGAAGAVLLGIDPLIGMGVFAAGGALTIGGLGRRIRQDVAVALTLVLMLGLGALFLSESREYSSEVYALLFGQILGVSAAELLPVVLLGCVTLGAFAVFFRPLLVGSLLPEMVAARGINVRALGVLFSLMVAAATTMSVPIVGALLMFSLMVGPPAAARAVTSRPVHAIGLSVGFSLTTVWVAIAAAYVTDWPVGFFVTAMSAVLYGAARGVSGWRASAGRRQPTVISL